MLLPRKQEIYIVLFLLFACVINQNENAELEFFLEINLTLERKPQTFEYIF